MNRMHTMLATAGLMVFIGCGPAAEAPTNDNAATAEAGGDEHAGHAHGEHEHGGWWCAEHGVPESECGLCDSKLAADFQRKGDWCDEHARPDSQCFACHPELEARFAARYEAKYGEAPPARTE